MKSILTVLGSFLFSVFVEGFIRVIIIFYHKEEFSLFGITNLPGLSWVIIILFTMLIISWLAGMLTITISEFSPVKHLVSLTFLFIVWRLFEVLQTYETEPVLYHISIVLISLTGIYLAFLTHKKTNATN